jgi:hypothetical protein
MLKITYCLLMLVSIMQSTASSQPASTLSVSSGIAFIENKGQVHDQDFHPRHDVLFSGQNGPLVFHLRNDGVSYQLSRVYGEHYSGANVPLHPSSPSAVEEAPMLPDSTTIHRLDIRWLDSSPETRVYALEQVAGHNNYYYANCTEGVLHVKSHRQVRYDNLYEGIHLRWYDRDGELEYDFEVGPGADYGLIRMEVNGAETIHIDSKGNLVFKTPFGEIAEEAPVVMQDGKKLEARWVLDGKVVSFEIDQADKNRGFVIDPVVRGWSTYYGEGSAMPHDISTDKSGNAYMAGSAMTSIGTSVATSGSHQATFAGGAPIDAFLVKFDAAGVRQWGTYYGGTGHDFAHSCTADNDGAIYLCGQTMSTSAIATVGSHQPVIAGGAFGDAFLVKFNGEGIREWGTFYGGDADEIGRSCHTDANGDVYLAGHTTSITGIATGGSHQDTFGGIASPPGLMAPDAFLVKFNNSGVRQWGTYYGSDARDMGFSCVTDKAGNVYLSGESFTPSGNTISTPGCHQALLAGGVFHGDAFLVKFDNGGVRQWGTYYGGIGDEQTGSPSCLTTDSLNNVYLTGTTWSPANISTPGSHQQTLGGSDDAYLVKFNSAGVRQWGTYYGDIEIDYGYSCATDSAGNVYLSGTGDEVTVGNSIFTTPGVFQSTYGGNWDAFIAKFNPTGVRQWSSFFGGLGDDAAISCAIGNNGDIFIGGWTSTGTGMTTPGCHQPIFNVGSSGTVFYNPFLAKLIETTAAALTETVDEESILLYPNPATNDVFVRVEPHDVGMDFQITDALGKVVLTGKIQSTQFTIDLENICSGLYLFHLGGSIGKTSKIIKQ